MSILHELVLEALLGPVGAASCRYVHLLDEVERTCDRVLVIDGGVIVAQGTVEELRGPDQGLEVVVDGDPSALLDELPPERLRSFATDDEHYRLIMKMRHESAVLVPLIARGRTLGVLTLSRFQGARQYDQDDVELAGEVARRAALALDNARLFSDVQRTEAQLEAVLGNIAEGRTMLELVNLPQQRSFGRAKLETLPAYCRSCDVRFACNGGCPKDRFIAAPDGEPVRIP